MIASDQIITVIETICDKIGIVVQDISDLIPAFTRYGIASHGLTTGVCGVCLAAGLVFLIRLIQIDYKNYRIWEAHKDDWQKVPPADVTLLNMIGFIVAVVTLSAFWLFCHEFYEFVGWMASPKVKLIYEIINMMP